MENFKKIILPNGLRVILAHQPSSLATCVAVLVEAGSKYETKELNGLSHFLEHMCFKGTKKRPTPLVISSELDSLGGQYNAFTTQEFTSYYTKARNESLDTVLDIIADIYTNSTFSSEEIEKEKGVIIEEINMYEDLPARKVEDIFLEVLYGDQPAGWSVAGKKEVIQRIRREDFITYRKDHYVPQATTLVVAGGFDDKGLIEKIEKYFNAIPSGEKGKKVAVTEAQTSPNESIVFKESDQTHLIMGFRAFPISDERRFALDVLADILGGGMSSRLFQKVRGELGAAYYISAGADLSTDHGVISMNAGVNHEKVEVVLRAGLQEFLRFMNQPVSAGELKRSKDHLVGNLFLSLETSDKIGFYYGIQEVMGLPLQTPEYQAERIQKVTSEEIQALARELFRENRLNLALIGPFKNKSFRDILKA